MGYATGRWVLGAVSDTRERTDSNVSTPISKIANLDGSAAVFVPARATGATPSDAR